jgi:hypothetical protein
VQSGRQAGEAQRGNEPTEQDEQCEFGVIILVYGDTVQTGDEGGKSNLIFTMELRVGPG